MLGGSYTPIRNRARWMISRSSATSSADIAEVWPSAQELGLQDEAEAFALQVGHGIGITHWGKPVISRFFSFENPETIQEGMVIALETYCGEGNDGARIEEQFVVTKNGLRQLSKFPSQKLISCPCVGSLLPDYEHSPYW